LGSTGETRIFSFCINLSSSFERKTLCAIWERTNYEEAAASRLWRRVAVILVSHLTASAAESELQPGSVARLPPSGG
ncbi:hypothetical protein EIP91_002116, partial [Steccherinum ochraceum]